MNDLSGPRTHNPRRKMLISAVLGGIAGFFAMMLIMRFTQAGEIGDSSAILSGVGLVYLLLGGVVGIGTLMPHAGAKILNVEDGEELIEQRSSLLGASFSNAVIGVMMIALANSGTGGAVPVEIALACVLIALVVFAIVAVKTRKYQDELMRQVSLEAASVGGLLVMAALLIWGVFAMNGIGPDFDAKSVIALVMGMTLLGAFISTGMRGMLKPR